MQMDSAARAVFIFLGVNSPWKIGQISVKVPVKNDFCPWKFSWNYAREKKNCAREKNQKLHPWKSNSARENIRVVKIFAKIVHLAQKFSRPWRSIIFLGVLWKTGKIILVVFVPPPPPSPPLPFPVIFCHRHILLQYHVKCGWHGPQATKAVELQR